MADERRIALVVREWGHQSTLYAWTWCKQYLFRRSPDGGLDPRDKFHIVKIGKEGGERWKVGGPLIPDLETACADYPHTIVKLDGSLQNNVKLYLEQCRPDLLVMGDNLPSPALQITSPSDYVKQSVSVPFVLIRAAAVRNARLRLSSCNASGFASASANRRDLSPERPVDTPAMTGRKIAIAYPNFDVGRGLMQLLREKLLSQQDTIYICHTFAKDNAMNAIMTGGKKFVKAMTLDFKPMDPQLTEDGTMEFGAKELEGFRIHLNVVLKGDPKSALPAFCEKEAIDLLVIGSRSGGLGNRIRKTLSGGSVSSHLIDNAPCPCLVVPHRYLGLVTACDSLDDEVLSPAFSGPSSPLGHPSLSGGSGELPAGGTLAGTLAAPSAVPGSHSTPSDMLAVLQQQLEEKDRTIAELRAQVQALQLAQAQQRESMTHDPGSSLNL